MNKNEELWAYCNELQREIARLKATIAKLTGDKKEKGKGPEIYCKKPFYNINKISFGEINYENE